MNKWTDDDVKKAFYWSAHFAQEAVDRVKNAKRDKGKTRRLQLRECTNCYYFRGALAGQAFTVFNCANCELECVHPNTNTPKLCAKCADDRTLCVRCGGDRK